MRSDLAVSMFITNARLSFLSNLPLSCSAGRQAHNFPVQNLPAVNPVSWVILCCLTSSALSFTERASTVLSVCTVQKLNSKSCFCCACCKCLDVFQVLLWHLKGIFQDVTIHPALLLSQSKSLAAFKDNTTACSKSVFQGTQSTEQTNAANGSIGTDIKPSRSAFSMPLSGRVSYAKLQCCAVYRGSCGIYSCICSCVSVACRGLFTGRRDIHFLSSRNAEYPSPNMWILPTISVVPRKRKKQKNVTLRGALIREQRMGLFLGKMAEQCVRSGSGVILNKTE